jgi:ATP-dependent helicase HrpA
LSEKLVQVPHPKLGPGHELTLKFPDLPVTDALPEIAQALEMYQVVIVVGETGSGKTTQLPKLCLMLGRGRSKGIVHTQPRRLAARAVATRIAEELETPLGDLCGYQVRFQKAISDQTAIKLVTDGLLLAEFRDDPLLSRYDTIIIDEAHERSLNIDFLLGILSTILPKRPDLKVIVTSATIHFERFSQHFSGAPVVEVSGRSYPVEIRYAPMLEMDAERLDGTRLAQAIQKQVFELRTIDRTHQRGLGDVLVFLPGEREIREVSQFMRHAAIDRLDVLPLYARLGSADQQRIFHPSENGRQRMVLATNVAETSLTVPGIRYVIDSGLARMSRYAARSRLQRLPIEPISQASANQRAGRCGRTEPGVAIRLYAESDYESRSAYTDPEIQRTNLASVVLQCLDLKLGDPAAFPFVDPPEAQLVKDGFSQLRELDLVTAKGGLTALGRTVARLPLDPRIGRMLLAALDRGVFWEVSVVAAGLSIQDPKESGFSLEEIRDPQSDFVSLLKLWTLVEAERELLSQSKFRLWCQRVHLNANRLREWREIHRQIVLCFPKVAHPVDREFDRVGFHVALLTGLAGQIGRREEHDYLGVRNRRFRVAKGALDGKAAWVVAAELVETHRVMARTVAVIEPAWVVQAVPQLLKFSFQEPFWSKKQGRAMCYRTTRLFGLALREREAVGFASIDPKHARQLLIADGIIAGEVRQPLPFMQHNAEVFAEAATMEAKLRRSDSIFAPDEMVSWFDARLPEDVLDMRSLEHWWKRANEAERRALYLSIRDLLRDPKAAPDPTLFPEQISLGHLALPAEYQFKPGQAEDGISVKVPMAALMQLRSADLEWTVPGALAEKAEALIRSLPKAIRRQLVPIPDFVRDALQQLDANREGLTEGLARLVRMRTGVSLDIGHWQSVEIDSRLKIRIEVLDESGAIIDSDRDLEALQARLQQHIPKPLVAQSAVISNWPPDRMFPDCIETEQGGVRLHAYPRLSLEADRVVERLIYNPVEARLGHADAVAALLVHQCNDQIRLLQSKEAVYQKARVAVCSSTADEHVFQRALVMACVDTDLGLVLEATEFAHIKHTVRANLVPNSVALASALVDAAQRARVLKSKLTGKIPAPWIGAVQAMRCHLAELMDDPLITVPPNRLIELPRYLNAIEIRLEKLSGRLLLDAQWQREVDQLVDELRRLWPSCPSGWRQQESELVDIRWQIEEFRVLCFAQILKRGDKVSMKRISTALKDYRAS